MHLPSNFQPCPMQKPIYSFLSAGSGRTPSASNRLLASSRAQVETLREGLLAYTGPIEIAHAGAATGGCSLRRLESRDSTGHQCKGRVAAKETRTRGSGSKTHVVSGLKARAMPVATKLPQKMYMGHSQPSGSTFSPGLMPQSQPVGGSNCWPPPPPCRRVVMEKFLVVEVEVADWRTQRTEERRGAAACRKRAMAVVLWVARVW